MNSHIYKKIYTYNIWTHSKVIEGHISLGNYETTYTVKKIKEIITGTSHENSKYMYNWGLMKLFKIISINDMYDYFVQHVSIVTEWCQSFQ